jgi:hypothetical protein
MYGMFFSDHVVAEVLQMCFVLVQMKVKAGRDGLMDYYITKQVMGASVSQHLDSIEIVK